jgi:hypothetical protein
VQAAHVETKTATESTILAINNVKKEFAKAETLATNTVNEEY